MFALIRGILYTVALISVYLTSSIPVVLCFGLVFLALEVNASSTSNITKETLARLDNLSTILKNNSAAIMSNIKGAEQGFNQVGGFDASPIKSEEKDIIADIKILGKGCGRDTCVKFLSNRCKHGEIDWNSYPDDMLYSLARGLIDALEEFHSDPLKYTQRNSVNGSSDDDEWADEITTN